MHEVSLGFDDNSGLIYVSKLGTLVLHQYRTFDDIGYTASSCKDDLGDEA